MKNVILAAVLTAVAGMASAQGYAGALAGLTKFDSNDCPKQTSCDNSDAGFKVYGGYQLAPNFAVEAGYTDFGKSSIGKGDARLTRDATAYTVLAVLRGQVMDKLTGVGRFGWARVKVNEQQRGGAKVSDGNVAMYVGAGVEYAVNSAFKITGAADFTKAEFRDESGTVYLIGVGAQYGF